VVARKLLTFLLNNATDEYLVSRYSCHSAFSSLIFTREYGEKKRRERGQKGEMQRKDNSFLRLLLLFQDIFFSLLK